MCLDLFTSPLVWSGRPGLVSRESETTHIAVLAAWLLSKKGYMHNTNEKKTHTRPTIWLFHFSFHRPFCWMRIVRIFHTIARITQMYMHNTLLNCMEQKEGNNECLKESWGCWWNSKMLGNGLWRKLMGSGSGKMI